VAGPAAEGLDVTQATNQPAERPADAGRTPLTPLAFLGRSAEVFGELLVAHFGVPLAGAVLVAINTRLAPDEVRYILDHSGAGLVVADTALHPTLEPVAASLRSVSEVVAVDDTGTPPTVGGPAPR
jgi:acyl-CoA synthetase (AMP-forming)/AMP-acid ligase II